MDLGVILLIGGIILLPVIWFLGGFVLKILLGVWPAILSIAVGGYILWENGIEAFLVLPFSIIFAVVFTWLWQRTTLFLNLDDLIARSTFID